MVEERERIERMEEELNREQRTSQSVIRIVMDDDDDDDDDNNDSILLYICTIFWKISPIMTTSSLVEECLFLSSQSFSS